MKQNQITVLVINQTILNPHYSTKVLYNEDQN